MCASCPRHTGIPPLLPHETAICLSVPVPFHNHNKIHPESILFPPSQLPVTPTDTKNPSPLRTASWRHYLCAFRPDLHQKVSTAHAETEPYAGSACFPKKLGQLFLKSAFAQYILASWRYSYLLRFQAGGHPRILLQGTARVVVGGGIPLEVEHELGDGLLHLQRHNCHDVLFLGALTVKANLPARGRERKKEEFPWWAALQTGNSRDPCQPLACSYWAQPLFFFFYAQAFSNKAFVPLARRK